MEAKENDFDLLWCEQLLNSLCLEREREMGIEEGGLIMVGTKLWKLRGDSLGGVKEQCFESRTVCFLFVIIEIVFDY